MLSKERVFIALKELGFSNSDAQVYVFLAKHGPHRTEEIALALNLHERKVHRSLKELQSQKLVTASVEEPLNFFALAFEELIDLFIKMKKEQAKVVQESKEELLSSWRVLTEKESEDG
jgi:sugar-specific transcriptional regulator TrmB